MGLTWGLSACGTAPTNTQFDGVSSQTTTPPLTRPITMIPPSSRALGVNYNGEPDTIDLTQVQRTGADWIRVFIDYSDWKANPHQFSAGFQKLHQAHSLYKLVVNLTSKTSRFRQISTDTWTSYPNWFPCSMATATSWS